jgi:arsenite transporter
MCAAAARGLIHADPLTTDLVTTAATTDAPILRRLSVIDRFLPLWIFAAMAIGVGLGHAYPDLGAALDRVQLVGVSVPIGVGLLWMMYPVLA